MHSTLNASLTPVEIAKQAGISAQAVYNAISRGVLPARQVGRKYEVAADDAQRWIAARAEKQAARRSRTRGERMTRADFARAAGISERTATSLASSGEIEDYTEAAASELSGLQEAKQRKALADAKLAELKLAREEGKVYDAARIEQLVTKLAHAASSELRSLVTYVPTVVAEILGPQGDAEKIRARLAGSLMPLQRQALARLRDIQQELEA